MHTFQRIFNTAAVTEYLQDAQLLTDIRRVQKETDERAAVLQKIAADMEDDLEELTNFTENVNSRRPKGDVRLFENWWFGGSGEGVV